MRGERDALAEDLAATREATEATRSRLDATASELGVAQERAGILTQRLSEVLEEQAGLAVTTEAQREELAGIRAELETAQGEVARLSGARGIYTVQPGDSLSSIASFFYRDGNRWTDILAANDHLIDDPDLIFSGMVLIIPSEQQLEPEAAPDAA